MTNSGGPQPVIENQMEVGGAVVFWALAEWSDRERLKAALEAAGLGQFLPPPRPASAALRSALEEALAGPRVLIRPLAKRDGFAVVREQRGERGNAYLPTSCRAWSLMKSFTRP
jgi:hypothetical protein